MSVRETLVRPVGKGSGASRVVRLRKPRGPKGVTIMDVRGTLRWCQTRLVNTRANPTGSRGEGKNEGYRSQRGYPSKPRRVVKSPGCNGL